MGGFACFVCAGSDGGRASSLLLLPEEGDGEPGPADGLQSSEDEEAGEGDLATGQAARVTSSWKCVLRLLFWFFTEGPSAAAASGPLLAKCPANSEQTFYKTMKKSCVSKRGSELV